MRILAFAVAALLFIPYFSLQAADAPATPLALEEEEIDLIEQALASFYPISLEGGYYSIGNAKFRTEGFKKDQISFTQGEAAYGFKCPLSENWGLIFGAGWVGNEVKMTHNPNFEETHFSYVTFSLGTFTRAFPDWIWSVFFEMSLDTHKLDLGNYTLYDGILWGKYTLSPCVDLTFGMVLEIGLNKTQAWPILGVTYTPWEKLKLNAVYPIDISLEYEFLPCIKAAGSIRFIRSRHRVSGDEPNPFCIFEYRTMGTEFDLIYAPSNWFWIKGFVGSTYSGDFKVSNSNNKHATHFKFGGAPYGGISAELNL